MGASLDLKALRARKPVDAPVNLEATRQDGLGCHSGKETMARAAQAAGMGETLDALRRDYPTGPHDQPQSMCPAFGSLRVGLRMRRTATILSGSACCVYGLTFTSHFYGARRTVGYVPFNSETLVTGKLFEDIRDAVRETADPALTTRSSSSISASPPPPACRCGSCPARSTGCGSSGSTFRASACRPMPRPRTCSPGDAEGRRGEAEHGPVAAPRQPRDGRPTIALLGEMFPADPMQIGALLDPLGLSAGPVVPTREWREFYAALDCTAVAAIHPFYTASLREFEAAGRPAVASAPVGHDGTAAWLDAIGEACGVSPSLVAAAKNGSCRRSAVPSPPTRSAAGSRSPATRARNCWSPACSSRVAPRCLTSAPPARAPGTRKPIATGSRPMARGCSSAPPWSRTSPAVEEFGPDLAIGTTPVVQKAKERAIPALYFTNLISARPLMGVAGAGSLAQVINGAMAQRERFDAMRSFFAGVGTGHAAGIWEDVPKKRAAVKRAAPEKPVGEMA